MVLLYNRPQDVISNRHDWLLFFVDLWNILVDIVNIVISQGQVCWFRFDSVLSPVNVINHMLLQNFKYCI